MILEKVFGEPAFELCFLPPQRNSLGTLAQWRLTLMGTTEFGSEMRCLDIYVVENIISAAFRRGVLPLQELATLLEQMLDPFPRDLHYIDKLAEESAAAILDYYFAHGQAGAA